MEETSMYTLSLLSGDSLTSLRMADDYPEILEDASETIIRNINNYSVSVHSFELILNLKKNPAFVIPKELEKVLKHL